MFLPIAAGDLEALLVMVKKFQLTPINYLSVSPDALSLTIKEVVL